MSDKLCPFNSFNKCIGEDCALYLKKPIANVEKDGKKIDINLSNVPSSCSFTFMGLSSIYSISEQIGRVKLSKTA